MEEATECDIATHNVFMPCDSASPCMTTGYMCELLRAVLGGVLDPNYGSRHTQSKPWYDMHKRGSNLSARSKASINPLTLPLLVFTTHPSPDHQTTMHLPLFPPFHSPSPSQPPPVSKYHNYDHDMDVYIDACNHVADGHMQWDFFCRHDCIDNGGKKYPDPWCKECAGACLGR